MNYFVISNDGQKYGPGDVAMLNQWAREGRVVPTTMLEDAATGQRLSASQVPGIIFPPVGGPTQNFQQAPSYAMGGGVYDDGSSDITKVWIFSALSFLCCGLLGIPAIVFASNAQKKGHPQAGTAMIVAIVALIFGLGWLSCARHIPRSWR